MKRIGIVGENYDNDSKPLRNLLSRVFDKQEVLFIPILPKFRGNQLERIRKLIIALKSDIITKKIDYLILMRDLDGLPSESKKIETRNSWFKKVEDGISKKCVRFLIIYELEALLLSDIATFNKIYSINYKLKGKPKFQKDPKGTLKKLTAHPKKTYHESHAADIFQELDHQKLVENHSGPEYSYEAFIKALKKDFKLT